MLRVKICGITQPEHGVAAAEAGADYLGFVFVPGTRRYLQPAAAGQVIAAVRAALAPARTPGIVGLFVNEDPAFVNDVADACGLDLVQIHGEESPDQVAGLNRPAICALRPRSLADLPRVDAFAALGARILIDAYQPGHWGGAGVTGDWSLAAEAARRHPIILAGGLSPANVAAAIKAVCPWGVDVSSGVETAGRKDPDKIRAFIHAAGRVMSDE
ncbi:MAG: phosphoribosylanthranilate isomerase [Chloroflexi bacterium]|nr:phosphoribosylanthranilate isomerase [Chloroflexota bacterium]